jgi:hypothetical protein
MIGDYEIIDTVVLDNQKWQERLDTQTGKVYYTPIKMLPYLPSLKDYIPPNAPGIYWEDTDSCPTHLVRTTFQCHTCPHVNSCIAPQAAVGRVRLLHNNEIDKMPQEYWNMIIKEFSTPLLQIYDLNPPSILKEYKKILLNTMRKVLWWIK